MGKQKVGCKKVLGRTICHVGSAMVMPREPVTIDIYKSHDCLSCPGEIKRFKKNVNKLNGFAKLNVKDVDEVQNIKLNLLGTLPVVDFGNGITERGNISKMDERDIVGKIIEAARTGEVRRSISS